MQSPKIHTNPRLAHRFYDQSHQFIAGPNAAYGAPSALLASMCPRPHSLMLPVSLPLSCAARLPNPLSFTQTAPPIPKRPDLMHAKQLHVCGHFLTHL